VHEEPNVAVVILVSLIARDGRRTGHKRPGSDLHYVGRAHLFSHRLLAEPFQKRDAIVVLPIGTPKGELFRNHPLEEGTRDVAEADRGARLRRRQPTAVPNALWHSVESVERVRSWHRAPSTIGHPPLCVYDRHHAAATMWLSSGLPLGDAARRLGHSVDTLVSHYVGALQDEEDAGNAKIERFLDGARDE
jgi:integrase